MLLPLTASFSLGLEGIIRDIRGGTRPRHHQAVLVEQETQFPANNPAMIGEAFAADLLGAAAFAHGVDELDAIRADDTEDRGSPKKARVQS